MRSPSSLIKKKLQETPFFLRFKAKTQVERVAKFTGCCLQKADRMVITFDG